MKSTNAKHLNFFALTLKPMLSLLCWMVLLPIATVRAEDSYRREAHCYRNPGDAHSCSIRRYNAMAEKLNGSPTEDQCLDAIIAELIHIDPYWTVYTQQEDKNNDRIYNPISTERTYSYRRLITHLLEGKYIKKTGACRGFKDQWLNTLRNNAECSSSDEICQKQSAAAVILHVLYQRGSSMQNKKLYAILFHYKALYDNNKKRLDEKFNAPERSSEYYTSALSFLEYIGLDKPTATQIKTYETETGGCLTLNNADEKMACILYHTQKIIKEICPRPKGLASGSGIALCRKSHKNTKSLKDIAQIQRNIFKGPLQNTLNRTMRISAFPDHRLYIHASAALLLAKGAYTFGQKLQGHCCFSTNKFRTDGFCSNQDIDKDNCPAH